MAIKHLLATAALAAGLLGAVAAGADTVIGAEDPVDGFIGNFLESQFPALQYLVASDGESPFRPFGATFDVSDGLDFSGVPIVWEQAADSHWTSLGNQVWVLPSSTTCGTENEPLCEPVGHFFTQAAWSPKAIGNWLILESPNGAVSDRIVTFNSARGAELLFFSDPHAGIPEASTWALMLVGIGGLGAMLRRARQSAASAA